MRKESTKMRKFLTALTALSVIAALLTGCAAETPARRSTEAAESTDAAEQAQASDTSGQWERTVQYQGKTWHYNSRLRTVLFLGIDSRDTSGENHPGVGTGGRSDTIILLVIDPDAGTVQPVTLSRDTMTNVDVYDRDRNFLFSGKMQLTMQYSFGDNPKRSCLLAKSKVSEVLHGIPIQSYISLTMDGIVAAGEAMGGVTVTLEEDWTDIDPTYTAGSTITMDGPALESFIRYRDTGSVGSNNVRMERHRWFVHQMFLQLSGLGSHMAESLLNQVQPYMETDMDGDTVKQLTSYRISDTMLNVPGETVHGQAHDEYYIDEDALEPFLLELFYTPVQ